MKKLLLFIGFMILLYIGCVSCNNNWKYQDDDETRNRNVDSTKRDSTHLLIKKQNV